MFGRKIGIFRYNRARRNLLETWKKMIDMKFKKSLGMVLAAASIAAAGGLHAASGDPAAGQQKNSMCTGCHGIPDYRTAFPEVYSVPRLGGQHAAYIVKALQEYKSGARSHPSMKAIAAGLSDQDMADLAAYYASELGEVGEQVIREQANEERIDEDISVGCMLCSVIDWHRRRSERV